MKHIILLFSVCFGASCCPKRTDVLAEDLREWIPYTQGDSVFMLTTNSIRDTFVVRAFDNEMCGYVECGSLKKEEYSVEITNNAQFKVWIFLTTENISFFLSDSVLDLNPKPY